MERNWSRCDLKPNLWKREQEWKYNVAIFSTGRTTRSLINRLHLSNISKQCSHATIFYLRVVLKYNSLNYWVLDLCISKSCLCFKLKNCKSSKSERTLFTLGCNTGLNSNTCGLHIWDDTAAPLCGSLMFFWFNINEKKMLQRPATQCALCFCLSATLFIANMLANAGGSSCACRAAK